MKKTAIPLLCVLILNIFDVSWCAPLSESEMKNPKRQTVLLNIKSKFGPAAQVSFEPGLPHFYSVTVKKQKDGSQGRGKNNTDSLAASAIQRLEIRDTRDCEFRQMFKTHYKRPDGEIVSYSFDLRHKGLRVIWGGIQLTLFNGRIITYTSAVFDNINLPIENAMTSIKAFENYQRIVPNAVIGVVPRN